MENLRERIIPDFQQSHVMKLHDQHIVRVYIKIQGLESEDFSKSNDILQDEQMQKMDVICVTESHCAV